MNETSHWNSLQTVYGFRIAENCPVVVERGAFLQNAASALVYLQLKFANYGPEPIRRLVVSGMLVDAMYAEVPGGAFHQDYADLHCEMLGAFGSKNLIQVPSTARYVWITHLQITYASGATEEYLGDRDCCCRSWSPIDLPAGLRQSLTDVEIEPSVEGEQFHRCCCGSLSANTIPCPRCGRTLEQARFAVTREGLRQAAPAGFAPRAKQAAAPAGAPRPWEAAPDEDKFPLGKLVNGGALILMLWISVPASGNTFAEFFRPLDLSKGWWPEEMVTFFSIVCLIAIHLPVAFAFIKNTTHKWWTAAGMMTLSLLAALSTAASYDATTGFFLLIVGALVVAYLDFVDRKKYTRLHTDVHVHVGQTGAPWQQDGAGAATAKAPGVGPRILLILLAAAVTFLFWGNFFDELLDDNMFIWVSCIATILLYIPVGIAFIKNATHKWWFVVAMAGVSAVAMFVWEILYSAAGIFLLILTTLVIAYLDFADRKKHARPHQDVNIHINGKR